LKISNIDRRISVAPMMDWRDFGENNGLINGLSVEAPVSGTPRAHRFEKRFR
jgi:hypothetical protein